MSVDLLNLSKKLLEECDERLKATRECLETRQLARSKAYEAHEALKLIYGEENK